MKTKFFVVFFALLPCLAWAQSIQSARSEYISYCENEGDEFGLCACTFDSWAQTVPADSPSQSAAVSMIGMITESAMPSMDQMQKIQPYMASFSQAGMKCAMGDMSGMESMYAGGGNDYEGQMAETVSENTDSDFGNAFGRLLSGDTSALGDIVQYDAQQRETVQRERAQTDADRKAEEELIAADKERLREKYYAELGAIENSSILNRSLTSYKSVHTLYCQIQNRHKEGYSDYCDCSWQQLTQIAQDNSGSANLTAYMSSISEGDIQREEGMNDSMFSQAYSNIQTFYDRRYEVCSNEG